MVRDDDDAPELRRRRGDDVGSRNFTDGRDDKNDEVLNLCAENCR